MPEPRQFMYEESPNGGWDVKSTNSSGGDKKVIGHRKNESEAKDVVRDKTYKEMHQTGRTSL